MPRRPHKGRRRNFVWFSRHGPVEKVPCHWCGKVLTYATSTVDHVIPRCRGGTNDLENMVIACSGCNAARNKEDQKRHNALIRKEYHVAKRMHSSEIEALRALILPLGLRVHVHDVNGGKQIVPHVLLFHGARQVLQWWPVTGRWYEQRSQKKGDARTAQELLAVYESLRSQG